MRSAPIHRSSLELVYLIEEILTRRYLAGDDDTPTPKAASVAFPRLFREKT
jgi:hypothetical protein